MADRESGACWTCARCEVTTRWMSGHERLERPPTWTEDEGRVYCLACRRELAADAALNDASPDVSAQDRAKLRAGAVAEFEVDRDPDRSNAEIARAIRSSVPAVMKARERLKAA